MLPEFLSVDDNCNGQFSRRSSLRSSITSIDSSQRPKTDFYVLNIPNSEESLKDYVKNLSESFKRSHQIRDILAETWIRSNCNAKSQFGNTLLHIATQLEEVKLVSVLCQSFNLNLDELNNDGNSALHLSIELDNVQILELLLKHGANGQVENKFGLNALQLASLKCHLNCLEVLHKYTDPDRWTVLTSKQETLLHLACKGALSGVLDAKDLINEKFECLQLLEEDDTDCRIVEHNCKSQERFILDKAYPCLDFLLENFKKHPDLLEIEDGLETSPGLVLHYFTCLNHVEGVKSILNEPFLVNPNALNKNQLSALWIASWYNMTTLGRVLLEFQADPNVKDAQVGYTPLHNAILGYHIQRVEETCSFLDALLESGADPKAVDKSGETAPHLSIGTLDFRIMSKFLEHLDDIHDIRDEGGNTLFHYAVGYLDEDAIYHMMYTGADLMTTNCQEVLIEDVKDFTRSKSITIKKIPLQEAMKNGNSQAYFNALRRLDIKEILGKLDAEASFRFLCMHLTAATREVRPDLVRILFHHVGGAQLHRVLLFKDLEEEDETFAKTALEWAVENNDRLCTTEILHQEFECHQDDRKEGLNCLRQQLTGDELLTWTIETFTMFYEKTWAQMFVFPLLGLIPVLLSIFTFVFDYYSDFELTYEYYQNAFQDGISSTLNLSHASKMNDICQKFNQTHFISSGELLKKCYKIWLQQQLDSLRSQQFNQSENCIDIQRTSEEYRTAFFVNIICISLPVLVFYIMCSRELWDKLRQMEQEEHVSHLSIIFLRWLYWPMTLICAPFFILYMAVRQLIFKFQHLKAKRKNKVRRQLQKSEYLWGISRTAEAALESCGQLVLQIWLLSSDFHSLSRETLVQLLDMSYNGVIFFLSFSYKEATDIEKSLGKMLMSLLALVAGVAASYRTLKRGAVKWNNTLFIYFSLAFQLFARIFALGIFFFTVRNFMPTVPLLLGLHFLLVFGLKWTLERARHTHGRMALLVAILNIFASSLVYVRILPIDKQIRGDRITAQKSQQHSTFMMQTLFFLLVFVENILLASWPLIKGQSENNRALACLGQEKLIHYIVLVAALCVCSWIFHVLYYKYMGHPWTEINGPQLTPSGRLRCSLHLCGKEKYLTCDCYQGISIKNVYSI